MDCAHHVAEYAAPPSAAVAADAVNEILSRRAYRPGWTFHAYPGDTTRLVHVEIDALVEDSYNPGQMTRLHVVSIVPPFCLTSELEFDKWLAWRLQALEIHESQEWLRKPGRDFPWVPVFNPHRDGADRDRWPIVKRQD
jgi:hypothetical protein